MNIMVIAGRLCADPVIKETPNGIECCNFCVAVQRQFRGQNGERETDFFDCVCWRQTAKFLRDYAHKGDMVAVSGAMQIDKWETSEGEKRKAYKLNAERVDLLTRKTENDLG